MSDPRADELGECLKRLEQRHGRFIFESSFGDVVILVAQIQLALRHPGNRGYAAKRAREIIEAMIDSMAETEPRVRELMQVGFDPGQDVP